MSQAGENPGEQLVELIDTLPALLGRHGATRKLAAAVQAQNIRGLLSTRFTVAVVGQMRAGKSTLLNALLGEDLAPTAVNECTATINRFLHPPERHPKGTFRVHWKDGSEANVPLTEVGAWIGRGENVERTRLLDFFSGAPFLTKANIVDTPGLRSTIEAHERTILEFLSGPALKVKAERLEEETRAEQSVADAIVYVVNPVGRRKDEEILELFGAGSRLPGADAYNSVAVVQRWEQQWSGLNVDPVVEAREKCERLHSQLEGRVSEVVPASGLLARCLAWLDTDAWERLAHLGSSTRPVIEELVSGTDFFTEDAIVGCPLDVGARKELRNHVITCLTPGLGGIVAQATWWPIVAFLLKFSHFHKCADSVSLRAVVDDASGIANLTAILQRRFFARSRLLKLGAALSRIWDPCNVALEQLLSQSEGRDDQVRRGGEIVRFLESRVSQDRGLDPVLRYLKDTVEGVAGHFARLDETILQIQHIKGTVEETLRGFEADVSALEKLDQMTLQELSEQDRSELRRLFGAGGLSLKDRLGKLPATLSAVEERRQYWTRKRIALYGPSYEMVSLAILRLEIILGWIENGRTDDETR